MSDTLSEEIMETSPMLQSSEAQDWDDGWAKPIHSLKVDEVPEGVTAMNIQGRHPLGALQGFGQLWKKTYRVRLSDLQMTPAQVMQVWKERFPQFQPPGNKFYPPKEGVMPGKVMFINSPLPVMPPGYNKPGIVPMMSGVMILYADEESFGVMTPEGFPVAGWNNFSVFEEDGTLVAQVQSFERASDPIYEFGFRLMGGAARQEFIWVHVLTSLAAYFGIQAVVTRNRECLDPGLQWRYARNIWQNAGIRTTIYTLGAPIRWAKKLLPIR